MSRFDLHTSDSAPASSAILDGAQKALGFVPNLYATMAESPALLEGYTTLAGIFDKTELSATERQIVLMSNNRLNGCDYCMAAHSTISQMQGVSQDVIDALRSGSALADPKLEALRTFAVRVNESRGWPSEADIDALIAAGYTKRTVFEVVLGTGLKVLSNYTNHIAATDVDEAFAPNTWSPDGEPARS